MSARGWTIALLLAAGLAAACAGQRHGAARPVTTTPVTTTPATTTPATTTPATTNLGTAAPAKAFPYDPGGRQTEEGFHEVHLGQTAARYLLFIPRGYEALGERRWPLILFLHGAGERGDDLALVKRHGPPKLVESDPDFPFVVVSPQCPAGETWSNEVLDALLERVIDILRIDERRVYLTGLSMGGFGAWSLAQEHPERFAAVVPICGGGTWERAFLYGDSPKGAALRKLPFWAIHGDRDPVVKASESERMVDALRAFGGDVRLTLVPGGGHDVWTQAYDDPELYRWLSAHARE